MAGSPDEPSIHFRRRWYYVLWVVLLAGAAGFLAWWETPSREGVARVGILLKVPGSPPGTRGALWSGPTAKYRRDWDPGVGWSALKGEVLALGPQDLRIAHRRMRQGLLMRRTDDLAVVVLEAPSGERRFFVYDLREDLGSVLRIGRHLSLEVTCPWERLPGQPAVPDESRRTAVGH